MAERVRNELSKRLILLLHRRDDGFRTSKRKASTPSANVVQEPCTYSPNIGHSLSSPTSMPNVREGEWWANLQDSLAVSLRVLLSSTYL